MLLILFLSVYLIFIFRIRLMNIIKDYYFDWYFVRNNSEPFTKKISKATFQNSCGDKNGDKDEDKD